MKLFRLPYLTLALLSAILISACGSNPTPAPASAATLPPAAITVTLTPDPCAPENIKDSVNTVHHFMREFDDASALASNTTRDQLRPSIADLQKIRRDAEDNPVPECLGQLKQFQINHMNMVINTLIAFMSGADSKVTDEGIANARKLHDAYTLELAHLLGITVIAQPTSTGGAQTPSPDKTAGPGATAASTQTPSAITDTPTTPAGPYVTVPGPSSVNMRKTPSLNGESVGFLLVGSSASVIARNADSAWILITVPGQPGVTAWVYASLVRLSTTANTLPVATPAP